MTSVVGLLRQCALGCIAARSYVHTTFLQAGNAAGSKDALGVQVKGQLEHKGGANDLVTMADLAVQELIVTALLAPKYRPGFCPSASSSSSGAAGQHMFDIIGEEELEDATEAELEARVAKYGPFIERAAASPEYLTLAEMLEEAGPPGSPLGAVGTRHHLAVFIDPIDATVAFVNGSEIAPMTLVGITRDGVPVGGCALRVFDKTPGLTPPPEPTDADTAPGFDTGRHMLPVAFSMCMDDGPCVLWGEVLDESKSPLSTLPANHVLRATYSSSTKDPRQAALLSALQPFDARPAKGGGNKIMMVAQASAKAHGGSTIHPNQNCPSARMESPNADFLVSVTGLKLWDTCAPHAFLRWLGGEVYEMRMVEGKAFGRPLKYDGHRETTAAVTGASSLIAVSTPGVFNEVVSRLEKAAAQQPADTAQADTT